MGFGETARLLVNLDLIDNMSAGLGKAQSELAGLEAQAGRTGGALGGIGSTLKAAAVGFVAFAAAAGVADLLSSAAGAALAEESSIARLTASLKANIPAWDGNRDAIEKVLQSRMRLGVSDDEQRESLSRLAAATHNIAEAQAAEDIALDLSAFKRVDLATATDALTKIEAGRFRGLADLGIQVKANATEEEALAAVHKVTAGAAEALAATNEGKLKASQVAIGESMEKIGGVLLPALSTGLQVLSGVVDGVATVFKGFGDILGGVGDVIGGTVDNLGKLNDVNNKEAQATIAYNLALTNLQAQFANGLITQEQYLDKSARLAAAFDNQAQSSAGFTREAESSGEALDNLAGRAQFAATAIETSNAAVYKGIDYYKQWTTPIKDTGAGLDNVLGRAQALAAGLDTGLIPSIEKGKDLTKDLVDVLLDIPTSIESTVRVNIIQTVSGVGAGSTPTGVESTGDITGPLVQSAKDRADAAARAREEAGRKAAADEKQRQQEIAAAITDRYQTAKRLEDEFFAKVHQNRLKEIQDTLTAAQTAHTAAIAAIQDTLRTQLAANAQPVNAAQTALADVQNQQSLRNLTDAANKAFTAAQAAPSDEAAQLALRDAREALANFKAQLNITALQQQQAVKDAAAHHTADLATLAADKTLATADQKAKHDIIVENGRYATQQRNFNNAMDRILGDTVKKHQSLNTALQRLIDLINHYAGKPLPTKEPQGRVNEAMHIVNVNVPPITIGARAITSAMSSQVSPSQSPFVRSGQARPKIVPGQ